MTRRLLSLALVGALVAPLNIQASEPEACAPVPATFQLSDERTLHIDTPNGRIEGTLAAPAGTTPKAIALLLHGYTGSRNEQKGMFRRAAKGFAERGIATLRIDFIGSGRSDGAWADTRFSTQARDAIAAASALKEVYAGALPAHVLGFSQGGLVALHAGAMANPFERMALWNPVMDPLATYGIIFGQETILRGAESHANGDDGLVEGTRLKPGFFAEILNVDPTADAARSAAHILIVTGQRDPLVKRGAYLAQRIAKARKAPTQALSVEAGHDLGAIRDERMLNHVIACTAAFLLGKL